jgi:hypothetical protein
MKTYKLLTRDQFRESVFARDGGKCVFCDKPAVDAHHILERRLWTGPNELGGYFIENGASVCAEHHMACETTEIPLDKVREACGITHFPIPEHLYPDQEYDKWGNPIQQNGQRLRGELFHDESVQKVLKQGGMLGLFTHWVKYHRSYHLPWSNMSEDDRMMPSIENFIGRRVIVTEKLDGEQTSMYQDHIHTRSLDSRNHPSRNWVKQFWSTIRADLPDQWRLCGENLYAKHSIYYNNLDTYFYGFSLWNDKNICMPWDETMEWFKLLGVQSVPVLYDGIYDEALIKKLWDKSKYDTMEGYVVRLADSFAYSEFSKSLGKFVRPNHITCSAHWMFQQTIPNRLKAHGQVIHMEGEPNE